jgi:hypothetical protein
METPHIVINWIGILVAVIAAFVFGGIWYGPLLGKTWAKEMGFDMSKKPDPKVMKRAFILQFIGIFLTAYVLAHSIQVWQPSAWGVNAANMPRFLQGFMGGVFTWLGFYIPMQLGKVSWEMKSWKLFAINTGHDFINLQIIAQILSHLS